MDKNDKMGKTVKIAKDVLQPYKRHLKGPVNKQYFDWIDIFDKSVQEDFNQCHSPSEYFFF